MFIAVSSVDFWLNDLNICLLKHKNMSLYKLVLEIKNEFGLQHFLADELFFST